MLLLRVSEPTSTLRRLPFVCVDDTDGKTPEPSLTFSASEIKVSKNGGNFANSAGSVTEKDGGDYYYEATAGELDAPGFVEFRVVKSGVRTYRMLAQVVAVDVQNSATMGLTDVPVNVKKWRDETPNALVLGRLQAMPFASPLLTVATASFNQFTIAEDLGPSGLNLSSGVYNWGVVYIATGAGAGQTIKLNGDTSASGFVVAAGAGNSGVNLDRAFIGPQPAPGDKLFFLAGVDHYDLNTRSSQILDAITTLGTLIGAVNTALSAAITTVSNKLGAWTGSGVNTVLGWARAMANKAAGIATPSDITSGGGTFNNQTESAEALRDQGDAAWGGGGSGAAVTINSEDRTIHQGGGS